MWRTTLGGGGLMVLLCLPAVAQENLESSHGTIAMETVADGLVHPWGLAFLPGERLLVTERPGRLRIVSPDGTLSEPVKGLPEVFAQGQGGLLDVALAPDFADSRQLYFSYAEPGEGGASTAVARARLEDGRLAGIEVIFRQEPKVDGGNHFGGRLVFAGDGTLFVTLGERFKFDPAQDLSSHLGTVVRIGADGSVPPDNPFGDQEGAEPAVWTYGHRNVQAAARHPETGMLWIGEMGPEGGDELNLLQAGRNYGWPLVSWGQHYSGHDIPDPPTRPELEGSLHHWTPVISPSGMIFYGGDAFADWQGDLLIGSLTQRQLVRLSLKGQQVTDAERLEIGARVRDVREGPDGAIYLLTDEDDGAILKLTPQG
jgi:aldose sugar dehydrogenase